MTASIQFALLVIKFAEAAAGAADAGFRGAPFRQGRVPVATNIAIVNALRPATALPCEHDLVDACLAEKGKEPMRSFLAIVIAVGLLGSTAGCFTTGVCDCDPGSTYRGTTGAFFATANLKPAPSTQLPQALPAAPAVAGQ
jgi:hypothetical protein